MSGFPCRWHEFTQRIERGEVQLPLFVLVHDPVPRWGDEDVAFWTEGEVVAVSHERGELERLVPAPPRPSTEMQWRCFSRRFGFKSVDAAKQGHDGALEREFAVRTADQLGANAVTPTDFETFGTMYKLRLLCPYDVERTVAYYLERLAGGDLASFIRAYVDDSVHVQPAGPELDGDPFHVQVWERFGECAERSDWDWEVAEEMLMK